MIELRNICKSYRTKKGVKVVLNQVNAVFRRGQNIGILGRNGAGKSTLLRLIGGAELPTSGQILRGASISWPIGFSGGFHGSLTGRENLRFIARIYNADIDKVTSFVEGFSELGEYLDMPVSTYSSGMKSKLAFGLSMAIDFDFYLIDEVTAVGDESFRAKSKAEFTRRRDHSTLIVVSHNVATIREYCSIAAVLDSGKLVMYDQIKPAIEHYHFINKAKENP
jgi:capsular polysaccharide transport system ATP-binding protein